MLGGSLVLVKVDVVAEAGIQERLERIHLGLVFLKFVRQIIELLLLFLRKLLVVRGGLVFIDGDEGLTNEKF